MLRQVKVWNLLEKCIVKKIFDSYWVFFKVGNIVEQWFFNLPYSKNITCLSVSLWSLCVFFPLCVKASESECEIGVNFIVNGWSSLHVRTGRCPG